MRYWKGRFQGWGHGQETLAIAALLSLPLIFPLILKRGPLDVKPWIREAERLQGTGNTSAVLDHVRFVVESSPEAVTDPRVQYLRAWAIIGRVERGDEAVDRLRDGLEALQKAQATVDTPAYESLLLAAARTYSRHGMHSEAADLYRKLEKNRNIEAMFELPRELALLKRKEALDVLESHFKALSDHDASRTLLLKADILGYLGRPAESIAILSQLEPTYSGAELYLRRGKAKLLIHDLNGARQDFLTARTKYEAERDPPYEVLEEVTYRLVDVYQKMDSPDVEAEARRLMGRDTPLIPLVQFAMGKYYLHKNPDRGLDYFREAMKSVSTMTLFYDYGFEDQEVRSFLRKGWADEEREPMMLRYEAFLEDLSRHLPDASWVPQDRAEIMRILASRIQQEAFLMAGADPNTANRLFEKASGYFLRAAIHFARVAEIVDIGHERRVAAYRSAADAYFEGRFYTKAAQYYHLVFSLTDHDRYKALFRQALSLKYARLYTIPDPDVPDALRVFQQCVEGLPPTDPLHREALLEQGKILMELSRLEEASKQFRLFLDDDEGRLGVAPEAEQYKQALYHYGYVLYRMVRSPAQMKLIVQQKKWTAEERARFEEARTTFLTFLERYTVGLKSDEKPHPLSFRAAGYLAMTYMMDGQWELAKAYYDKAITLGTPYEFTLSTEEQSLFRQAHFYRADAMVHLGRFQEAVRLYDYAIKKYPTDHERIWGLIGKGRALLKMDMKKEASVVFQTARQLLREETLERPSGSGTPGAWTQMLDELESRMTRNAQ